MVTWFTAIYTLVLGQRMAELAVSRRNARWVLSRGGYEAGRAHYSWLVLFHVGFFIILPVEVVWRGKLSTQPLPVFFLLFLVAQGLRIWVLLSLGRYWNTRIMILPGSKPVTRGPYRFIRHPNYLVVAVELACLPLTFGAYYTALLFTLGNALLLRIRIREEEKALAQATCYEETMGKRRRFLPL